MSAAALIRWHDRPKRKAYAHAAAFLGLELTPAQAERIVDELRHGQPETRRAEDVLKGARREPLAVSDPGVQRQARRAAAGKKLRPVLVVTLPDGRDEIADGLHRVSMAFHHSEKEPVAVVHAGGESTDTEGALVGKKAKRIHKIEKAMGDLHELRKHDLDPGTRESVRKSARELELSYMRATNPHAAAIWEAHHRGLLEP